MADRYGRKPPLLVGLALFMLGSLGCALARLGAGPDRLACCRPWAGRPAS